AIPDQPVANATDRTVILCHGAHQFSPRRVCQPRVSGMDGYISGLQRVDSVDFKTVWVFFHDIVGLHPTESPRAANDGGMRGVERPQPLMHGLMAKAQTVQDIGHRSNVQIVAHPLDALLSVISWRSVSNSGMFTV